MNKNNKHTPGEWSISSSPDYWDNATVIRVNNEYKTVICPVCKTKEMEANARLIAAAPELLEALELAIDIIDKSGVTADCAEYGGIGEIQKIRAAIAKAKGE